jgi:hypothetical protein
MILIRIHYEQKREKNTWRSTFIYVWRNKTFLKDASHTEKNINKEFIIVKESVLMYNNDYKSNRSVELFSSILLARHFPVSSTSLNCRSNIISVWMEKGVSDRMKKWWLNITLLFCKALASCSVPRGPIWLNDKLSTFNVCGEQNELIIK